MKPSFAKKLTASYLFVVAVTLLITGLYLTHRLKATFLSNVEQSLDAQAHLMLDQVAPLAAQPSPKRLLQEMAHHLGARTACRVTVIRANGVVMGDSERSAEEVAAMDNHGARPEVLAALASGTGEAQRYSRTLKENMLYVAVPIRVASPPTPLPVGEGSAVPLDAHSLEPLSHRERVPVAAATGGEAPWGVLRIALPLTEVHRRVSAFQNDLFKAGAAALGVAFVVAFMASRKTIQPLMTLANAARAIGEGQFPQEVALHSRDEFGQLARAFSDMSGRIEEKVKELSQERTQLSAILAALVEGVVAVDHEGRLLFLNPAAERLFAVRSRDIIGRPVREVLRHMAFQDVVQETLRTRTLVSHEITLHSPHERTLKVQALPVAYGDDRTGVLAALHDITELRKLERLRQEFVANVSHELKTPLTAIKGYVETLLEGALEDKTHNREFLKIIEEHARHLSLLIDDVLDLSAIEAKRVDYRFEAVSLAEVTAKLIKGLAPMAKAKDVKIENQLSDKLARVRADRDKLAQVLMNLIDNAIKFNKTGGRVILSAVVAGGQVSVSVQDTGVGIAAEDLPRIFERFYRADKARSHEIAGTGLGLAIVKHLIEAQQGIVTAESRPGEGSTFTFTLPCI